MEIVDYANSSYARDLEDRKFIMGYYFFLKGAIITWFSQQKQTISMSIFEAKYIAMSYRVREDI